MSLVIINGCVITQPFNNVKPQYVSPLGYQNLDCHQLNQERQRISDYINKINQSNLNHLKITGFNIGLSVNVDSIYPTFKLNTKSSDINNPENQNLVKLHGERDAITQASKMNQCQQDNTLRQPTPFVVNRNPVHPTDYNQQTNHSSHSYARILTNRHMNNYNNQSINRYQNVHGQSNSYQSASINQDIYGNYPDSYAEKFVKDTNHQNNTKQPIYNDHYYYYKPNLASNNYHPNSYPLNNQDENNHAKNKDTKNRLYNRAYDSVMNEVMQQISRYGQ